MTALYSLYRSQRFDDLVGQQAATRTLRNAVASGRVSHAYLFTGIRGTGKTSAARILARAVNCLAPADGEPCNACANCVAISDASATDLIEIDAASNRGVDEMRDLRERARYLPSQLTRKVYIIDEAHQLTNEAFNALLKTLEEPPPHVLFVLCTTEAHKLPATVVGRCQRFEFRRIGEADIAGRLEHIAGREGLAHDAAGLRTIAAMAQGSMRDAVSMLDQLASAGVERVDAEAVRRQLGLVESLDVAALLADAAAGDRAAALRRLEALAEAGADLRQLTSAIAEMARRAVLLSLDAATPADLALEPAAAEALAGLRGEAGRAFSAAAFEAALAALAQMKQAHDPRMVVELLLLRMAGLGGAGGGPTGRPALPAAALAAPLAPAAPAASGLAEAPGAAPAAPVATPAGPVAAPDPVPTELPAEAVEVQVAPQPSAPPAVPPVAAAPSAAGSLDEVLATWPAVLEALRGPGAATRVRALLNDAAPVAFADEVLTIGFRYGFHSETAQAAANRQELERALQVAYGRAFRLAFQVVADLQVARPAATPAGLPQVTTPRPAPGDEDPSDGAWPGGAPSAAAPAAPAAPAPAGGRRAETLAQAAVDLIGARVTDVRNKPRT
ncbi:MAG TPA: DNA polymerase III subunit gamma/tau [Candidatus Dormibacteraeota bacterium]|nr:DNA polymerase III subunit gamma/tau [Candidatus Dormibacteraeota bacterium]